MNTSLISLYFRVGAITLLCALVTAAQAAQNEPLAPNEPTAPQLATTRVVAHNPDSSTHISFDPKNPVQPIPAQDGAEILKTVTGFNVIRKGGTDGDPVFRGMAGSRLGILVDGENILGGCGHRMDPPTAYVFPSAYDKVTVIRGPQSVRHGPGMSAGTVLFEREPARFTEPSVKWVSQLTLGSFGRNDQMVDATAGTPDVDLRLSATRTEADDYRDGDGNRIHSNYERWSAHATLGWNADPNNRFELAGILSDGEAAYADRAMDGTVFERQNLSLSWNHTNEGETLRSIEAKIYYNYVDHVMDNYSLRPFTPTMMMPNPTASNPDRTTYGGRLHTEWEAGASVLFTSGVDYQANRHTTRSTMNANLQPVSSQRRNTDAKFETLGIFTEAEGELGESGHWFAGLRVDYHRARDERDEVPLGMMGTVPNPTARDRRSATLPSGFVRYEHALTEQTAVSIGLGHSQRFPDYWELISKESADSVSAFNTEPERTTQIDIGLRQANAPFTYSLNLFANRIDDYILIESQVPKGMRSATITRNIDAVTYGGELSLGYALTAEWQIDASVAYVRGYNRTDGHALAQQPPLEGRIGLTYTRENWSVGGLLRLVDRQTRVAPNQGNIVGQDIGGSDGFAVFSVNASWRITERNRLTAGVDNLFDTTYAEHLSRGGSQVAGFPPPATRVNEPGRNGWIQWQFEY